MAERALATAFVTVVPSMKGFEGQLRAQIAGSTGSVGREAGANIGSNMKQGFVKNFVIGGAVAGVFASLTAGITSQMGMIVKEAVRASDATDKFKQTLNFAGIKSKTIEDLSKSTRDYANKTVYDLATIQNATAQLAANGVPNYAKLVEASGNLNAVAGGNADTFRSVSMVLTQTAGAGKLTTENWNQLANAIPGASGLLQEAMLKNQAYTGNFRDAMAKGQITADEFNKALMQLGSQPVAVEAAKSTKTFEGALGNLKATLIDAFTTPLNAMKPQLTGAIDFVSKSISTLFSGNFNLGAALGNLSNQIVSWVNGGGIQTVIQGFVTLRTKIIEALAVSLPQALISIVNALVAALPAVVQTLLSMVPQLLQTAQTVFSSLLQALTTVVPSLLTGIADMLPKIVQTLTSMLPGIINSAINLFLGLVQGLVQALPKLIVSLLNALPKIISALLGMLPTLINGAVQLFTGLVTGLIKILPELITTIVTVVLPKLIVTLIKLIPTLLKAAVELFMALVTAVPKIIVALVPALWDLGKTLFGELGKMVPKMLQAGLDLLRGLVRGIIDNGPKMVGDAMKTIGNLAVSTFKNILGIKSPSKVFKEFGKNILQGLNKGLMSEKTTVVDTMAKVSSWVKTAFDDKKISGQQYKAANALIKAYSAQLSKLEGQYNKVLEKLDKAQQDLADKIQERADYIKDLAGKFGAALTIDTTSRDEAAVAQAKNDLAKAQADYNAKLADTKAALTDIEDARLSLVAAQERLNKAENPGTTAKSAIAELKAKLAKTQALQKVTDQLLQMGLSKSLYKQIVEAGAVDFAQSIIEGGAAAVDELNVLSDQADKAALDLASKVGDTLFNEGIQFAKSIVQGLQNQKDQLTAVMDAVASAFEKQISLVIQNSLAAINGAIKNAPSAAKSAAEILTNANGFAYNNATAGSSGNDSQFGSGTPWAKAVSNFKLMAAGGYVTGPTPAVIGEAGPEVVTPLKDFERMMGLDGKGSGQTINYYAAPNNSLDAEQALFQAIKRAKVVGAW